MKYRNFEEMPIWQEAKDMAIEIYHLTNKMNRDFRFVDQIRSSAVSVSSNIAEGFERGHRKEFVQFLYIAKGSLGELRSQIQIGKGIGYFDDSLNTLEHRCRKLSSQIGGFISFLKRGFLILVLCVIFHASSVIYGFAASGASFLKLGVGARALGLGSAYTAVANDVTALHWNPAGLSQLKKREVGAMHAELFVDTRYDFIGYVHPIKMTNYPSSVIRHPSWVFGIGAVYLSQGTIEGRSEDRTQSSEFSASDLAVTLGVATPLYSPLQMGKIRGISLGANLKLLQSKIAGYSSTGFALDLGLLLPLSTYRLPLAFGFAIQNIGPQMKFREEAYNLPLTLASGVALSISPNSLTHSSLLTLSADLKHQPYDSRTSFSLGAEFTPVSLLSLRAGYLTNMTDNPSSVIRHASFSSIHHSSSLTGLGMGIGLKLGHSTIDYAFSPARELGNSHRISLSLKF